MVDMRLLILGCGYVGSALALARRRVGDEVTGVVFSESPTARLNAEGITTRMADLSAKEGARMGCEGRWDVVVLSVASRGNDFRRSYLEVMDRVTREFLEYPPSCLIYTGSASVYAQTDGEWVTEDSATEPLHEHGQILLETERLLERRASGKFPAIVLRLTGIYGPGRHHELNSMRSGEIFLPGDGEQWKNQIHRDDVVAAVMHVAEKYRGEVPEFHVFNVSDDEPVTRRAYVAWLCEKLGRSLPEFRSEERSMRRGRGGFRSHRRISNQKLRTSGWIPRYPSFRNGMIREVIP